MNMYEDDDYKEDITILLEKYQQLKLKRGNPFIAEDEFEILFNHFNSLGQKNPAAELIERALEIYPFASNLLFCKAEVFLQRRKPKQALEILDHLLADNGLVDDFALMKIECLLELKETAEVDTIVSEYIDTNEQDDTIEFLFALADIYDDYNFCQKVYDTLEQILKMEPSNEEALIKICFWTDYTNSGEKSIALHSAIIDEHPYSDLAWFNLGAAYQGLKLYEKAIDAYEYALVINEQMDLAHRNMADAYLRLKKYKEAGDSLIKVIELGKAEDVIFEAVGYCYQKLKNLKLARLYYNKSAQLTPSDCHIYYKIAKTYATEKRWDNAIEFVQKALDISPAQADYNHFMGECKLAQGKTQEAQDSFGLALLKRPKNLSTHEMFVKCLLLNKHYDHAITQLRISAVKIGTKPILFYYMAVANLGMKNIKAAGEFFIKGFQLNPRLYKKVLADFNEISVLKDQKDLSDKKIKS